MPIVCWWSWSSNNVPVRSKCIQFWLAFAASRNKADLEPCVVARHRCGAAAAVFRDLRVQHAAPEAGKAEG